MISAVETRLQRKNTEAFIRADPERIVLLRRPLLADGAGGRRRGTEQKIRTQTVKFQRALTGASGTKTQTDEGRVSRPDLLIVCLWDADILLDDEFVLRDVRYRVAALQSLDYEKKAVIEVA